MVGTLSLEGLFKLHELDMQLFELRAKLAEGPEEIARRERTMEKATVTADEAEQAVKILKRDVELKQLDVQGRQAETLKWQGQLNAAKTNEEYNGLIRQIQGEKRRIGAIEEEILQLWEQIEAKEKVRNQMLAEKKQVAEGLAKFKEEIAADQADMEAKKGKLEAERAERARAISPEHLRFYERALERHQGRAMASCVDGNCTGCYMSLTANEQSKLLGGNEIMICRTCHRILYLESR